MDKLWPHRGPRGDGPGGRGVGPGYEGGVGYIEEDPEGVEELAY